jgi:uncharacterized LabA/DUF88 family protein
MKKTSDNTKVNKASRAKATRKVGTPEPDAGLASELDASLQDGVQKDGAQKDSAQNSVETELNAQFPGQPDGSSSDHSSGHSSAGHPSDRLSDEPKPLLSAPQAPTRQTPSAAFKDESARSAFTRHLESDTVDFLLADEASFSASSGASPGANPSANTSVNPSASAAPRVNTRPSVSEGRSSSIAPANSIRRHAINRAPNFQPNYPPVSQSSDRIAIFIDGSNLFYAASHLNIEVDYRRLLTTLVRGRRLLRAYFYTGVDPQNEKQRGFLLWLNRHGHRVVSKELVQLPDGSRKANMHVEMAVDMIRISEYCSTLTLLGGDGNLSYALEVLSQRGVSIEVVSLQSMTSDSLIDLADSYTDLADLRDEIKR